MELESDAERLASIQALGGELIKSDAGEFWAIFDNEYVGVSLEGLEVESRGPALTCRSCDVRELRKDAVLTVPVADGEYRLRKAEPETPAPGWTLLLLRK